ncbi:MAG: hypothetical protein U1F51_03490 [Burkholderiales bacterium]
MPAAAQTRLDAGRAGPIFERSRELLVGRYGRLPRFELRDDLGWPAPPEERRQLNLFVGPRAGLEVAWRARRASDDGVLVVRERGWLEYRGRAHSMLAGAIVALIVFAILLVDGFVWNRFIAHSSRAQGFVFHGGTVVLYAFVPAVAVGFVTGALGWMLAALVRPICRVANRRIGIEPPAQFLARLVPDSNLDDRSSR